MLALAFSAAAASASAESVLAAARQPASIGTATVSVVQPADAADIILLATGSVAGLRQGMTCQVSRDRAPIAELVLVDLRPHAAAGLILSIAPGEIIRPGDLVTVKLQSR